MQFSTGCGDVEDITANGGTMAPEADCAQACSGDPIHLCGGSQRLSLYEWQGNLQTWHTPANTGFYEVWKTALVLVLLTLTDFIFSFLSAVSLYHSLLPWESTTRSPSWRSLVLVLPTQRVLTN